MREERKVRKTPLTGEGVKGQWTGDSVLKKGAMGIYGVDVSCWIEFERGLRRLIVFGIVSSRSSALLHPPQPGGVLCYMSA